MRKLILFSILFFIPSIMFSSNLLTIKIFEENGDKFIPPGNGVSENPVGYTINLYKNHLDFVNKRNPVIVKYIETGENEVKLWNIPQGRYYVGINSVCFDNQADLEQNVLFYIEENDVKEITTYVKYFSYINLKNISDNPYRVVVSHGKKYNMIMEVKGNSTERVKVFEGKLEVEIEQKSGYHYGKPTEQKIEVEVERCKNNYTYNFP